jgi:uncharacterized protein YjbI with pentapeptide repeats
MADKNGPHASRYPYKAYLWTVLLVGCIVGLIVMIYGRSYFGNGVVLWGARLLAVAVVLIALIGLIRSGYHYEWTGFGAAEVSKAGEKEIRPRKTLWDWLDLLIVPVVLAVGALWFSWAQEDRQREIESRRAQAALQVEKQRAQGEAMQTYFNQMDTLLLEKDLRNAERTLARARTITVLERVDSSHTATIMQFLGEAKLVQRVDGRGPIIGLSGADLRHADLDNADLGHADLVGADLEGADLEGADLDNADLDNADLDNADLDNADLDNADLDNANLHKASLRRAKLDGVALSYADLSHADLGYADLSYADLSWANLSWSNLDWAVLREASLLDTNLSDADLFRANLNGATTTEGPQTIQAQARSFEGATMPNGQSVRSFENLSTTHMKEPISYEQTPPVGGPHAEKWQNCGFYSKPVHNENAVHSLEHGAVWITYRSDLPQDQVGKLQDLAHSQTYILISPYPDLPSPVVASAWGKQMKLEGADDPDLARFVQAYRQDQHAPEPESACTNGVGSPE